MSSSPQATATTPALPTDLHDLKRPALLALCRIWDVKASGKNTDLIYRLQAAAANSEGNDSSGSEDDDDDAQEYESAGDGSEEDVTGDTSVQMMDAEIQQDTKAGPTPPVEALASDAPLTSPLPRTVPLAFQAFQHLPPSSPGPSSSSPSAKRSREASTTPPPMPSAHPLKGRSTMAGPAHIAAMESPGRMDSSSSSPFGRKVKPLPRKSVLPGIKMTIGNVAAMSPAASTSALYPILPSSPAPGSSSSPSRPSSPVRTTQQAVPQFTFTCGSPPAATKTAAQKSDTTPALSASATSSVLAQLNARLAASGHSTLPTSPSQPRGLHHSPSASSLLRGKEARGMSPSRSTTQQLFDTAHESTWKKDAGIDSHWSVKRYRSKTDLRAEADSAHGAQEQPHSAKKVKREGAQAPSPMKQRIAAITSASATAAPPARSAAPATQPSSNPPPSSFRQKVRIVSAATKKQARKSRSSISTVGRMGRKSLVGKPMPMPSSHGGAKTTTSVARPSKPSTAIASSTSTSDSASQRQHIRPRTVSMAPQQQQQRPAAAGQDGPTPQSVDIVNKPVRRFFAFGSTTMKGSKPSKDPQQQQAVSPTKASYSTGTASAAAAPTRIPLSPSKTQLNDRGSANAAPTNASKQSCSSSVRFPTTTMPMGSGENSAGAAALRVAQARKKAAEESRSRLKSMQRQQQQQQQQPSRDRQVSRMSSAPSTAKV